MTFSTKPYRITPKEFFSFSAVSAFRSFAVMVAIYAVFGIALMVLSPTLQGMGATLVLLAFALPFLRGAYQISNLKTRISLNRLFRIEWDDKEMKVFIEGDLRGTLPFDQLYKAREFAHFFQIFQTRGVSFYLPKHIFPGKADQENLRMLLKKHNLM